MTPRKATNAGGIFLSLGLIVGALYGVGRGDPVRWMLIGFLAGLVLAVLTWLWDRRG